MTILRITFGDWFLHEIQDYTELINKLIITDNNLQPIHLDYKLKNHAFMKIVKHNVGKYLLSLVNKSSTNTIKAGDKL